MGKSDEQKRAEEQAKKADKRADAAAKRAGDADDRAWDAQKFSQKNTAEDRAKADEQRKMGAAEEQRLKNIGQSLQGRVDASRARLGRIGNAARDAAAKGSYAAMRQGGINPALSAINAGQQAAGSGAAAAVQGQNALADFDRAERGRNDNLTANAVNRQFQGAQNSLRTAGLSQQQAGLASNNANSAQGNANAAAAGARAANDASARHKYKPWETAIKGATALGNAAGAVGGAFGVK